MFNLKPYVVLITLIATLGGLLFGYDTAVISGTVGSLRVVSIDPQHLGPDAGNSLAVAAQWIANYVVSSTFPILKDSPALKAQFDGGFPYFVYGLMGILAALFIWKFVPETKGRTLEDLLLVTALSINLYRDRYFAYNPYPGKNQSWEDLWDIHGVITPA